MDRRIAPAVMRITRLTGFGVSPHTPVRLAIRAAPRRLQVRTLLAPLKIPGTLPQGCMRQAQAEKSWEEWRCTESHGAEGAHDVKAWLDAAEKVWIDMLGVEGENRSRHAGRSKGPRLVWKSALGPPADPAAFATRASRSWAKISAWMQTIKCALTHRAAQEQAAHPLNRSANVARRRILASKKWVCFSR